MTAKTTPARTAAITGAEAMTRAVGEAKSVDKYGDIAYMLQTLGLVASGDIDSPEAYEMLDAPAARNPEFVSELAQLIRKYR